MAKRILIYGDSNSWGCPPDGSGIRIEARWPRVMADELGVEIIEDALPGRTTVHDDPQMHGATQNGLAHFPASLLAAQPVDFVIIMLGTNDLKARYEPSAGRIAQNLARLVDCAEVTGGGPGEWGASQPPKVGIIAPHILPEMADDPDWDRAEEWRGGRTASLGLAKAIADELSGRAELFDAAAIVTGDPADPIHFGETAHRMLGKAVADWLGPLL